MRLGTTSRPHLLTAFLGLVFLTSALGGGVADADRTTGTAGTSDDGGDHPSGIASGADSFADAALEPNADHDGDGLSNGAELAHGTNLTNPDSDADGLPDGVEVGAKGALPSADPLRMDVYVEIDYRHGCELTPRDRERLKTTFSEAPVSNPSGKSGIALHLVRDDIVPGVDPVPPRLVYRYAYEYRDRADAGYHYVLLAPGRGYTEGDESLVTCGHAGVFVHELGHSLGLREGVTPGIDSRERQFTAYPSAMSYAAPMDYVGYSNGSAGPDDHDDWDHLSRAMETPPVRRLCADVDATTSACEGTVG